MEIQAASRSDQALLGTGYDVEREEFCGQCVRGSAVHAGTLHSSLEFSRSLDQSEMAKSLGFDASAKVRYGLFSGSAAAKFVTASTASEYSDVTVYSHTITSKNAVLDFPGIESGITPQGASVMDGTSIGDNWTITCGHEFVSQITLGGKLLISIRVDFSTRTEKEDFSANVSFSGPPVDVEAALQTASAKYGNRARVGIQAFQLGGDPRRLANVFEVAPGQDPFFTASLKNPDAVLGLLASVVDYGRDDFAHQLNPSVPLDSPVGPASISYITRPWSDLGLFALPAVVAAGLALAREELAQVFERHAGYQRRLQQIVNMRLSPAQAQRFQAMRNVVSSDLAKIQAVAQVAYSPAAAEDTPAAIAGLTPQLTVFQPEEFDVEPESFAQWWDMRELPDTLTADRQVVEGIADLVIPLFENFGSIVDQGDALQDNLHRVFPDGSFMVQPHQRSWAASPAFAVLVEAHLTELSMPGDGSAPLDFSLEHVAALTGLERIDVSGALVDDLSPIGGLAALRELVVRGPVADLTPVAGLVALERLEVLGNFRVIDDLQPLAALSGLERLRIDDGAVRDVGPLSSLAVLNEVSLLGSPVDDVAPLATLPLLRDLSFGSTRSVTEGVAAFAGRFGRFAPFAVASTIVVTEGDGATTTWTRRGTSNVFDTESPGAVGVAALVGFGLDGSNHVRIHHRRGDRVTVMFAFTDPTVASTTMDGQSFVVAAGDETGALSSAESGPSWSAAA